MTTGNDDLVEWCQKQRDDALRQLTLFGASGVKAVLQMPDGRTDDITAGVLKHQTDNIPMFERLIVALKT